MPVLDNARHERFAQGLASGMSGREAYMAAGFKSEGAAADVGASKLVRTPKVAARLKELQTKAANKTGVTLEWLIEAGQNLLLAAQAAEDFSAASATYERLAKITGNWVDRTEGKTTNTTRLISDKPQTEDAWLSQHTPTQEARPN